MIFDTSYSDKKITQQINHAVGNSFSFMDRIKMGGIGSRRMIIGRISEENKKYLNAEHYLSNANIELRPKGIIIHFRHKLQAYSWVMPFKTLTIEVSDTLRIESDSKFIVFSESLDQKFIAKLMNHFRTHD